MEGGFENPLPIPPRHHGNANNEYAGLGERRITHPSRYYEIIAGARRILEGRLESLDEEERGRYDENIRTQASKHEPVARVADEERWEKDAYVDDWSNIELLPSRLTAPWFGTFAMKTPRDADKQERWANRLLETYDSENPQGMSWCPISHGYLDKSDVVAAHIVRYNVGEPAAVHLFGPTDDPGGHIWSLSNGIPMHKRYQAALYDGRIAIIPTEDGEDLKVVVLEDALRRIQTVPGEPPYGQSLHERVLKFLNNDHRPSTRYLRFTFTINILRCQQMEVAGWWKDRISYANAHLLRTPRKWVCETTLRKLAIKMGRLCPEEADEFVNACHDRRRKMRGGRGWTGMDKRKDRKHWGHLAILFASFKDYMLGLPLVVCNKCVYV
ncbi:hypothetical protein F5Y08DRAFT_231624 [Xylaria arbuscula]|nr:hypothetical protein F5Y08DRAFT_231624 [Xylaria arbuscula]